VWSAFKNGHAAGISVLLSFHFVYRIFFSIIKNDFIKHFMLFVYLTFESVVQLEMKIIGALVDTIFYSLCSHLQHYHHGSREHF
jgi:hypothetical protein